MKALAIVLLLVLTAACATPPGPEPIPEPPTPRPAATVERVDPVEPTPVVEAPIEPRPEDPAPESAIEAEPGPEPDIEPGPAAEAAPEPLAQSAADTGASAAVRAEPAAIDVGSSQAQPDPGSHASDRAETVNLSGRIRILRDGREQAFAGLHLNQTVIAWRPQAAINVAAMEQQQIVTRRSRFFPQTMVVTSGTEIRFPNMDSIRHNVFSLTQGHQFDVGLYDQGPGRSHRFVGTGMVELYCNVHPNMAAFLLVLDTPHFINPDENGEFTLRGLPTGPGELLIWNYRAEARFQRLPMQLTAVTDPLDLRVDITRPAVPQHTNKHGEAYGRDRGRR